MQEKLQADLKTAMLAGDSLRVEVLKGLKSAIQNYQIEVGAELTDEDFVKLVQKEVKKRHEAADLYKQAGDLDRETKELKESEILQAYLPAQLSDEELASVVEKVFTANEINEPKQMGQAIGLVKKEVGSEADGARVAAAVKAKLGF